MILLAGGVGKDADFSELGDAVEQYCRQAVLFGRDRQLIAQSLPPAKTVFVETLEEAIQLAKSVAKAGDIVLFSPACASFDQFKNYVERGLAFENWVHETVGGLPKVAP